jgi:hypothetical protein
MSSNPANILIARSSRSSNTLSALVPTETHAAASAIFPRSSSSPPWLLEEAEVEDIDEVDASDENADTEPIEVDITFRSVACILRPSITIAHIISTQPGRKLCWNRQDHCGGYDFLVSPNDWG